MRMAETRSQSDMGLGFGALFVIIAAIAAVAVAVTAYQSALADNGDTLQLLSGVALTVAFVAGGIAIAAVHIFD